MNFLNQSIECPIGNGGGTCKTIEDINKLLKTDIAAIEIGSITWEEKPGNEGNTFYNGNIFTLNSLGLPNPGEAYYERYLLNLVDMIHKAGKYVILNVVGFSTEEYAELTRMSFDCGADMVVLNYGCPNIIVDKIQKGILTYDIAGFRKTTIEVLSRNLDEARQGRIGIKLSPIFDPRYISTIAEFLNSLADIPLQQNIGYIGFITTMNTVPNCYDEDNAGLSFINPAKGLSGMAGNGIFPIALGQVKQFRTLLSKKVKIIGVGGIDSGSRMRKMIRNGADFVQVASAYYTTGNASVFNHIGAEFLGLQ